MINCVVCDEGNFKSKVALAKHRSEKHFYKCPECFYAPKEYKLIDSLRHRELKLGGAKGYFADPL